MVDKAWRDCLGLSAYPLGVSCEVSPKQRVAGHYEACNWLACKCSWSFAHLDIRSGGIISCFIFIIKR